MSLSTASTFDPRLMSDDPDIKDMYAAWVRRHFGHRSARFLRLMATEPGRTPYRVFWLRRVADALDAAGYRTLNDVPDDEFFDFAYL